MRIVFVLKKNDGSNEFLRLGLAFTSKIKGRVSLRQTTWIEASGKFSRTIATLKLLVSSQCAAGKGYIYIYIYK